MLGCISLPQSHDLTSTRAAVEGTVDPSQDPCVLVCALHESPAPGRSPQPPASVMSSGMREFSGQLDSVVVVTVVTENLGVFWLEEEYVHKYVYL